ncbi:MAG: hypothetical protein ABS77_08000 [Phenylobacterium sp. SCN 69-14]|nr:MAG: hypothetical protein ABS77_08000 [Phenylobacterium sp. SCN 69-14]
MIRRSLLLAFAAMTAAPALAAESAKTGTGKDGPAGQYVDVSPVAIPILADGRLVNYVFVTFRVQLTAMADASKWRAKEPYFRDALARIGTPTLKTMRRSMRRNSPPPSSARPSPSPPRTSRR